MTGCVVAALTANLNVKAGMFCTAFISSLN